MREYVTRVSYNHEGWRKPSGRAGESRKAFTSTYGFGQEDWLLRNEWVLGDGWRYSFLQGVNKSYKRLYPAGEPFNVTLFTLEPGPTPRRRRYVARIREVACLKPDEATAAMAQFRARGWYETMVREIEAVGGRPDGLANVRLAHDALNICFRLENLQTFDNDYYLDADDPALRHKHIILSDVKHAVGAAARDRVGAAAAGSDTLPQVAPHLRRIVETERVCTPEHAAMQRRLMRELRAAHPKAEIRREVDGVDVVLVASNERVLFEIKSDHRPLSVIRQAVGQLLEYAYARAWPPEQTLRLVIVGRNAPDAEANAYLTLLRDRFGLPVSYRTVSADLAD